jgi:hypothetical protein
MLPAPETGVVAHGDGSDEGLFCGSVGGERSEGEEREERDAGDHGGLRLIIHVHGRR